MYTGLAVACIALFLIAAAYILTGCGPVTPCPVMLQTKYTAELVAVCKDAGATSMAACRELPEYAALRAAHRAEQVDAGCRK